MYWLDSGKLRETNLKSGVYIWRHLLKFFSFFKLLNFTQQQRLNTEFHESVKQSHIAKHI